ncbi:MAG: DNA polymerase III subunit delta' [Proteobacteria bacterium]|nr:DNA polymerase III subunit delta' [Pseudomonadota bacterium]
MFDDLIDQKLPAQILSTLVRKGNAPHALLFSGIEGVGKKKAALTFAMAANCESNKEPCGVCRSCKKIKSAIHPDIIEIKPSGKVIKIAQIRELIHVLSRKPYEALKRVIIIHDADAINTEAGNALLKVLEEPPDKTFFILITTQNGHVLPTIASRCQQIKFNPVSKKTIISHLVDKLGVPEEKALIIAQMADGNLPEAERMADLESGNHTNWLSLRDIIISGLDILNGQSTGQLLSFANRLFKKKDQVSTFLAIMKTCFRDIIIFKYAPEKIIFRDLSEKIACMSKTLTIDSMLQRIEAIYMAERAIQSNANLRLTLEVLMIRMSRV